MIYLYIPFGKDEENERLLNVIDNWHLLFERHNTPHQILHDGDQVTVSELATEGLKIYLPLYAAIAKPNEFAADPTSPNSISLEVLLTRLLRLNLPQEREVTLKLCVQQTRNDTLFDVGPNLIKSTLNTLGYVNPNLVLNMQCSSAPFISSTAAKTSYRVVRGSFFSALPSPAIAVEPVENGGEPPLPNQSSY